MSLFIYEVLIRLFMTFILSLLLTPLVKLLAFRIGAYDAPGERRINTKNMPTAGGLAIYIAFASSCLLIFVRLSHKIIFGRLFWLVEWLF